ncbi:ribosome rescue GTPase HflX [Spirabiliibacterium falconis]|uniref:ribosome rescue GTPase HflX n=1 Tax=Spirabiliibacterium falconis TaxID=572023 RepID=UPI001AACAAC9|nr:ribosome rescue GTPase HflX [Spirabiliibacterium falconis]MBE2893492.1 GTPase HflX [Spirabiliibacterium falconis]
MPEVDNRVNPTFDITVSAAKGVREHEKAILVHVFFSQQKDVENIEECRLLANSAGVDVVDILTTSRSTPQAKYFVGLGKAEEIAAAVKTHAADVVLVNHTLSAAQNRNLEQLCGCRVIDRTTLILDIFALRARSHEGKLQVELAQLKHISTRLVRGWTHLERQKGGVGLRGPGETQLETDRRLIKVRLSQLQAKLAKVSAQRHLNRRTRQKAEIPTVSIVGYTNAGKSTLFNALTTAEVYAADQLFATLDPTLRKLEIAQVGTTILADTVGFIRHLPHDLVEAFKSTLQETTQATLLLHVLDASDERREENIDAVHTVLEEIGADDIPQLLVFNKIDQCENVQPHMEFDAQGKPSAVYISAQQHLGLDLLLDAIQAHLKNTILTLELSLPVSAGKLRHALYQQNAVTREQIDDMGNFLLNVQIDSTKWNQLLAHHPELMSFLTHS